MTDAGPAPPPFVPPGFVPPDGLDHPAFRLRPLGPEHNASDYAAWASSIDHIRSTPGFLDGDWPHTMTLEANRGDLVRHAADFAARSVSVQSWVRAADAALDGVLAETVAAWLADAWPFERPDYVRRPAG